MLSAYCCCHLQVMFPANCCYLLRHTPLLHFHHMHWRRTHTTPHKTPRPNTIRLKTNQGLAGPGLADGKSSGFPRVREGVIRQFHARNDRRSQRHVQQQRGRGTRRKNERFVFECTTSGTINASAKPYCREMWREWCRFSTGSKTAAAAAIPTGSFRDSRERAHLCKRVRLRCQCQRCCHVHPDYGSRARKRPAGVAWC